MHWSLATKYKILLEINNAVISNTSKDDFFKTLSTELKKHFCYDRFSIFLYNQVNQSLRYFTLAEGVEPEGFGADERDLASSAVANMVIQSKKPVIIDDLTCYSEHPSIGAMVRAGLGATVAFPMIVRNRIIGTFHLSFKHRPDNLSELSESLPDVSNQIAIAVGNMISFTQLIKEKHNLEQEKQYLRSASEDYSPQKFLYVSSAMDDIMKLVEKVAGIDSPLLITGETGTGKDHLARLIHLKSLRKDHLFVKVSCPALTPSLFESELFGHAKGAFTGADSTRIGRFEMAGQGTVFLDEIAEIPIALQAKFLQVLQENRFERVGDNRSVRVNFRLITATNRDIPKLISQGQFRQDLYYRLNIIKIHVPPLRERKGDLPYLLDKINKRESFEMNRPMPRYTDGSIRFLSDYHWPGNIRELKNLIKRMIIIKAGESISVSDLKNLVSGAENTSNSNPGDSVVRPGRRVTSLAESELRCIKSALVETRGIVGGPSGAASLLGVPKSTLQYRLKKYEINPADYRT